MRLVIIFASLFLFTLYGHSQKVKFVDNIAKVDGVDYIQWKTESIFDPHVSICALDAEKDEIFVSYLSYKDPSKATTGNPEGNVHWIELNFLTFGGKCEIANRTQKSLVKFLINNKIYVDGKFNEENARMLITKYGMRFSENRPAAGVTVIINN